MTQISNAVLCTRATQSNTHMHAAARRPGATTTQQTHTHSKRGGTHTHLWHNTHIAERGKGHPHSVSAALRVCMRARLWLSRRPCVACCAPFCQLSAAAMRQPAPLRVPPLLLASPPRCCRRKSDLASRRQQRTQRLHLGSVRMLAQARRQPRLRAAAAARRHRARRRSGGTPLTRQQPARSVPTRQRQQTRRPGFEAAGSCCRSAQPAQPQQA